MSAADLRQTYQARYDKSLKPLAARVLEYLTSCLSHCERIDRFTARAKDIDSFLTKAAKVEDGRASTTTRSIRFRIRSEPESLRFMCLM